MLVEETNQIDVIQASSKINGVATSHATELPV